MKRVAIPVSEGKLSEYFGQCSYYMIFDIKGTTATGEKITLPEISDMSELPAWAAKNGITDIITYKIDRQIISLFSKYKIHLYVGVPVNTPENLISDYLNEKIVSDNKVITEIIDNE